MPTRAGWAVDWSSSEDLVVNSYTQPSGHFTSRTKTNNNKKQQREEGRKDKTTDLIQQHRKKTRSVAFFCYPVCIYALWNSQQLTKILTHLWLMSILWLLCPHAVFSTNVAILTVRNPSLPASLSLWLRVSDFTDQRPFPPLLPVSNLCEGSHSTFFVYFWRQDLPYVTHTKRSFRQFDAVQRYWR